MVCPVRCGEMRAIAVTTERLLVGAKTDLLLHIAKTSRISCGVQ